VFQRVGGVHIAAVWEYVNYAMILLANHALKSRSPATKRQNIGQNAMKILHAIVVFIQKNLGYLTVVNVDTNLK
jgi:hypothetical protein